MSDTNVLFLHRLWNECQKPTNTFELVPFDKLAPGTAVSFLVKRLIPRQGITVVWGPPKCGKSFWAFDLAMHIALGRAYRERKVISGPVVYCAFEGAHGFNARAEAFRRQHNISSDTAVPFYLMGTRIDLVKDHQGLIESIRDQVGETNPVCVTLDTLNRSLAGSESSDEDMTAYLNAADAIGEAFGCAVIIVHHCGVDGTRPRGHTSLTGTVCAQLAVKRDASDNVLVTVECMKDGPEGDVIASCLNTIELGADDDGDPITSCAVVPVNNEDIKDAPKRKLTPVQMLAMRALVEALAGDQSRSTPPSWNMPQDIRVVPAEVWKDEMYSNGALDRDATNPRMVYSRLRKGLVAHGLIGLRDELVWPVNRSQSIIDPVTGKMDLNKAGGVTA
jgi:hypothetical protein